MNNYIKHNKNYNMIKKFYNRKINNRYNKKLQRNKNKNNNLIYYYNRNNIFLNIFLCKLFYINIQQHNIQYKIQFKYI